MKATRSRFRTTTTPKILSSHTHPGNIAHMFINVLSFTCFEIFVFDLFRFVLKNEKKDNWILLKLAVRSASEANERIFPNWVWEDEHIKIKHSGFCECYIILSLLKFLRAFIPSCFFIVVVWYYFFFFLFFFSSLVAVHGVTFIIANISWYNLFRVDFATD